MAFAFFRHPDGSWYRLWTTRSEPKTGRGHPWHLHASYDKSGTVAPVAGTRWYELPYGNANWNFESEADALSACRERAESSPVLEQLGLGRAGHAVLTLHRPANVDDPGVFAAAPAFPSPPQRLGAIVGRCADIERLG